MLGLLAATLGLIHCSADSESSSGVDVGGANGGSGNANGGSSAGGGSGTGGTPPEQELESSFQSPVSTGKLIWTANPDSGRVALVDALSFEVRIVEAGLSPTYLAAVPGGNDTAVVLNTGSRDATLLRATADGVSGLSLPTHDGANAWALSNAGKWAIAWTNARDVVNADVTQGFQDVTVLRLTAGSETATRLSVGYRPERIFFSDDESRAFVISEPGISVIELDELGPRVTRQVEVTDDPLENPASRDVTITADGSIALVRRDLSPAVRFVNLDDGSASQIELAGNVTDLDLSASGSLAVAVVREAGLSGDPGGTGGVGGSAGMSGAGGSGTGGAGTGGAGTGGAGTGGAGTGGAGTGGAGTGGAGGASSGVGGATAGAGGLGSGGAGAGGAAAGAGGTGGVQEHKSLMVLLPLPGILTDSSLASTLESTEYFGSVSLSPTDNPALLYTNAVASNTLSIADTQALSLRTVDLKAPVRAVFATPDGTHAVVLQGQAPGSTKAGGFAIVPAAELRAPKIVGTDAAPMSVAISPDSDRALITVRSDDKRLYGVYLVQIPSLQVDYFTLASPPLAAGMVAGARRGFVAQEHPEGRVTFIDLDNGEPRTLTGFELGAKVVD
ncbi:MAG: YncE family protein [Polyangiaceae bacterium]